MSDVPAPEEAPTAPAARQSAATLAIASAREKLTRYLPRAVEIITELAETSENDRVRLAAAESIADRAGLTKGTSAAQEATQAEHDIAEQETRDLLARIQKNQDAIESGPSGISPEAIVVHEGEPEVVLAPAST